MEKLWRFDFLIQEIRKNYPFFFVVSFYIFSYFYQNSKSNFYLFFFIPFFHIPLWFAKIRFNARLLLVIFELLIHFSLVSTKLSFSDTIFFFFIHQSIISHILKKSMFVGFLLFMEIVYILFMEDFDKTNIVFLLCSLLPQILSSLYIRNSLWCLQFPSKTLIFAYILDTFRGTEISKFGFMLSILLHFIVYTTTWPRIPNISKSFGNSSLIYIIISLSVNIIGLLYGVKHGSTALVSSSILSLYNAISLSIVLVGSLISEFPATKVFTYGFHKIKHCFRLASYLVILASAVDLFKDAIITSLLPPIFVKQSWPVVFISFLDFIVTFIGSLTIVHNKNANYTMYCDIFISAAALISSLFDAIFNYPQFDIIVSFVICLILFVTLVGEISSSVSQLTLYSKERKSFFCDKFTLDPNTTEFHLWGTGSPLYVLSIRTMNPTNRANEIHCLIDKFLKENEIDSTIEISPNIF